MATTTFPKSLDANLAKGAISVGKLASAKLLFQSAILIAIFSEANLSGPYGDYLIS